MAEQDATEELLAQRGSVYGDPVPQYADIAQVWSGILGVEITGYQAALCMVGLKLVRAKANPDHLDSLDDAHGYVRIAQRVQETWAHPPITASFDELAHRAAMVRGHVEE